MILKKKLFIIFVFYFICNHCKSQIISCEQDAFAKDKIVGVWYSKSYSGSTLLTKSYFKNWIRKIKIESAENKWKIVVRYNDSLVSQKDYLPDGDGYLMYDYETKNLLFPLTNTQYFISKIEYNKSNNILLSKQEFQKNYIIGKWVDIEDTEFVVEYYRDNYWIIGNEKGKWHVQNNMIYLNYLDKRDPNVFYWKVLKYSNNIIQIEEKKYYKNDYKIRLITLKRIIE